MANGLTEIRVPDLGGAKGVTVLELLVAPGATVAKDTSLFVVEGDKATMEIPAPKAGVLVAFSTPEGGVISGLSSAMSLEGWTWEEMSMKGAAALNVKWPDPNAQPRRGGGGGPGGRGGPVGPPPKSYAEQVEQIKGYFAEARAYRDAVKSNQTVRTDARYASMVRSAARSQVKSAARLRAWRVTGVAI